MTLPTPGDRALRDSAALLPAPDRSVIRFHGDRWQRILNGLVTADLAPLAGGRAVYAFALTAKGRPLADLRILPRPADGGEGPGEVWLDLPREAADEITAHLTRSVPPIFARFEPVEARRFGIVGPKAGEALSAAAAAAASLPGSEPLARLAAAGPPAPLDTRTAGGLTCVGREPIEGEGIDLYVPEADAASLRGSLEAGVRAAGGAPVSSEEYERFRVERGLPVWGREITSDRLPQETGQTERAISFTKGCYTGQEVVARLHYRGHVNRLLRGLRLLEPATADAWSDGSELVRDGRPVGWVTSRVDGSEFGSIALGYVRREVEPGERVGIGGSGALQAEVVELPFTPT